MLSTMALFICLVYVITESYLFAVGSFIVFIFEFRKFIFPSKISLSNEFVTVKTFLNNKKINWTEFKRALPDKNGVLLSRYKKYSLFEKIKGLRLRIEN